MIAVGHLRRRYDTVSAAADGSRNAESSATACSWLGRISISRGYSFLTMSGTDFGAKVFLAKSGRPSQLEIGETV
jgi:hypothetical protein